MQCCNKHVIIYSGASVSELIRAIRSFIRFSIDIKNPEQISMAIIYLLRVALLSFIKESGTNIMAILFVSGWFTFIYYQYPNSVTLRLNSEHATFFPRRYLQNQ